MAADVIGDVREHVADVSTYKAIWEMRREPDSHARRCATDAVKAIDQAIEKLHQVRAGLISSIRQADDAMMASMPDIPGIASDYQEKLYSEDRSPT